MTVLILRTNGWEMIGSSNRRLNGFNLKNNGTKPWCHVDTIYTQPIRPRTQIQVRKGRRL